MNENLFDGDIELIEKIAVGGMGEVYLARQIGIGGFEKIVALKRILARTAETEENRQMFFRESNLAALLELSLIHI